MNSFEGNRQGSFLIRIPFQFNITFVQWEIKKKKKINGKEKWKNKKEESFNKISYCWSAVIYLLLLLYPTMDNINITRNWIRYIYIHTRTIDTNEDESMTRKCDPNHHDSVREIETSRIRIDFRNRKHLDNRSWILCHDEEIAYERIFFFFFSFF